ncbi:MAG: glycosyltransferase [Candidatus Eremiobacteraeota bacterium]|nr:glycosyltransferase [Candidatus Eremiobacteraeota bacterium]
METFKKPSQAGKDIPEWAHDFEKRHGRKPAILHIGNIANNAYINSKMLNKAGLDCDVLCYDYYHIMGCPEWEDADFTGKVANQFNPDWGSIDLRGYERPRWFAQGPLRYAINYLLARRRKNKLKAQFWWHVLGAHTRHKGAVTSLFTLFFGFLGALRKARALNGGLRSRYFPLGACLFYLLAAVISPFFFVYYALLSLVVIPLKCYRKLFRPRNASVQEVRKHPSDERMEELINAFSSCFPGRQDRLSNSDLEGYWNLLPLWKELFKHYDLIQGYATDGIYPLLTGNAYIAYEHGTIRHIPFQNDTQGRLCALTYRIANKVCITNADNIEAAKKLALASYRFIPHPVNEDFLEEDAETSRLRDMLHRESDFVVFHPSRQHWSSERHPSWEKGNDIFIEGFARFVKEVNPRASTLLVNWGKMIEESKRLIESLGITSRVTWIEPLPNRSMVRHIKATDALADQFFLGAFGSTMPKALACGRPALLALNEDLHRWCFSEMPPVVNAWTPQEVFEGLRRLYQDKEWTAGIIEKGLGWYARYHSEKVIVTTLTEIYREVI